MFSARTAMLMLATLFSVGAWTQPEDSSITLNYTAENIDGAYKLIMHGSADSDTHGASPMRRVYEIVYNRVFTEGVPATVVFPFPTTGMTVTGGNFYGFDGVAWDSDKGQWVAYMKEVDADDLQRNTPYIVVPTASKLVFNMNGNTVDAYTDEAEVTIGCWAFVGTYKKLYWIDANASDTEFEYYGEYEVVGSGDFYGFAAHDGGGVSAGEFVKCTGDGSYDGSAFIKPLRAYLQFVGDADHPANMDTQMLHRKSAAATTTLPTSIAVVFCDKDGEIASVGTISEKTGEVTFDGWFTLDGVKLPAEPTESGVYIHNGKKVVIK